MKQAKLWLLGLVAGLCYAAMPLGAQVVFFDDNFAENPLDNGWILNGNALWVPGPGDTDECRDPVTGEPTPNNVDPLNPCTVYGEDVLDEIGMTPEEFGGYVLVTPGANGMAGNIFRTEKAQFDSFKMTIVVEMRDGTALGRPADGMTVVVVGTPDPPMDTGFGGGGMGAPCVGDPDDAPILVWEFDDWSCNTGDRNNDNHVDFTYGPNGIPCTDSIPSQAFTPIAPRFHNQLPPQDTDGDGVPDAQAPPNRFELTVFAQRCGQKLIVATDLNAIDQGINLGRVFTHVIENFEPFEGYLGVTASTGGANQAHILHSARLESLPEGFCLEPAATATRDIQGRPVEDACGDFRDGDELTVTITVNTVREASECCDAATAVTVRDVVPDGWMITSASAGGTIEAGGGAVSWDLAGADLVPGKELSYTVVAADSGSRFVDWGTGTITENIAGSIPTSIGGETRITKDTPFDDCGGITCWNILGPYLQPADQTGNNPGVDNMRLDYLTDGDTTETDFPFFPGATIATDFGGAARSVGLFDTGQPNVNPDGVPTVLAWNDFDGFVNLNDDVYANDPNQVMSYAQIYLENTSGDDIEAQGGFSSDDSIQVLLNGEEVWINSVARGGSDACNPQDITPDFVNFFDNLVLPADSTSSLILKVFEGGGGFNFAAVLQDPLTGMPITEGIEATKFPPGVCPVPPVVGMRILDTGEAVPIEHSDVPRWRPGQTYDVSIALSDPRPAGAHANCPDPVGTVTIVEKVPAGWTPANPSDGGVVDGQTIRWTLDLSGAGGGGGLPTLTYQVTSAGESGNVSFSGTISEPGNEATFAVRGVTTLGNPSGFSDQGFINRWLLLGPFTQPTGFGWGAAPFEENIRLDFLTDGVENEIDIEPQPGDQINTDFGGAAASRGLSSSPIPDCPINPDGVPTWKCWNDTDDTINFNDYYCGDVNQTMMYAVVYVIVEEDMTVDIGLGSDDSIQVLLDGEEIWLNSVPRGSGGNNVVQDTICADPFAGGPAICTNTEVVTSLNPLEAGVHKLMVKVFEGGGAHDFRLRFQDPVTGEPITEGITVSCTPEVTAVEDCANGMDDDGDGLVDCADDDCSAAPACQGVRFVRGDADSNGIVQLTDAIRVLGFLFQGAAALQCDDAGDADDNGELQITDGIRILQWLFTGGAPPAPPGPSAADYPASDCGLDATDDALDCGETSAKCGA